MSRPGKDRIIDASLNRAAEGLRVVEDICRFGWNLPAFSRELKEVRHGILNAFSPEAQRRARLVRARDIEEDQGRSISVPRPPETDLVDLAIRNMERAREALRTLEEVGDSDRPGAGAAASAIRYRLYSLEKGILHLGGRPPGGGMAGAHLLLLATPEISRVPLPRAVRAALRGGVDAVELRVKRSPDREFLELGRELREITASAGVPFIVNDRPDLAVLLEADGIHLGQNDIPPAQARRIVGDGKILGISTHTAEQARQAAREGADYIGAGPVFETTTKETGPPLGPGGLRSILRATDLPAFSIGGIRHENLQDVMAVGASRAAIATGILGADTPEGIEKAARQMASVLATHSVS